MDPVVGQRLWPERIDFKPRHLLRLRRRLIEQRLTGAECKQDGDKRRAHVQLAILRYRLHLGSSVGLPPGRRPGKRICGRQYTGTNTCVERGNAAQSARQSY